MLAVEIATLVMRRGTPLLVRGLAGEAVLIRAAEGIDASDLALLREQSGSEPALALSPQRATALGRGGEQAGAVVLRPTGKLDVAVLQALADPLAGSEPPLAVLSQFQIAETRTCDIAAVRLAKLAGLLPSVLVADARHATDDPARWSAERGLSAVAVEDVLTYEDGASTALRPVARAKVPLGTAEDAQLVAFRPGSSGAEHLAIIIGQLRPEQAVLTRLHSACLTGDLLGSLRCDCGDQLRGAIGAMAAAGGGILLYLAQEGRGIGLVNKLRAYALQDRGLDTLDANRLLGFAADERFYRPAAEMLHQLGFTRIRLMTNNPDKVAAMARYGLAVIERVPLAFPSNAHNRAYLRTKAVRSGHYLDGGPDAGLADQKRLSR